MTSSTARLCPAEWCKSRGPDREGLACRSRMIEGHRVILRETRQSHSSKGINAMTARAAAAHGVDVVCEVSESVVCCR
jgi:hypothetical protein